MSGGLRVNKPEFQEPFLFLSLSFKHVLRLVARGSFIAFSLHETCRLHTVYGSFSGWCISASFVWWQVIELGIYVL